LPLEVFPMTSTQQQILADSKIPEYPTDIEIGELTVSNDFLGDRNALEAAWERDGYWYFRNVLDREVIRELRDVWMEYLHRVGLIDADVNENRYNHSGFEGGNLGPADLERILEFNKRQVYRILTENPRINATMRMILGDDPFWLPQTEYRANPPGANPSRSRLIYPHQDGFYSRGLEMKICWIPVDRVDLEMGGCAWLQGGHKGPILHDLDNPPLFPIRKESIPLKGWKTATFEPGDIVIFDLNTPHTGLTNVSSDRFRMSFDIRVTEASGKTPSIGRVVDLTQEKVTIEDEKTKARKTFLIDGNTYVRSTDGKKREGADIPKTFEKGETVVIASGDGRIATLVRAIH
jgi:ectoine hydroxylase-related dioxygenase (phytanoyl-CoA dioxygenase family)